MQKNVATMHTHTVEPLDGCQSLKATEPPVATFNIVRNTPPTYLVEHERFLANCDAHNLGRHAENTAYSRPCFQLGSTQPRHVQHSAEGKR